MHPYWDPAIVNDRIDTLRREADRHRLAATAARDAAEPLSTRLHTRLATLLTFVSLRGPQSQPCTC